ncbi:Endonuclease/exonuclease/phosphatase [Parasponia andersonii]|uniref:Endonuclease/exonuclease/phosphatase n=1 Tax=Parasponia andersonii TaxID=3476 RepID=A0A2P5D0I2_PARAD|nr:Endonuclease/exonuclease/phosphatase [Parasponia andersonii]
MQAFQQIKASSQPVNQLGNPKNVVSKNETSLQLKTNVNFVPNLDFRETSLPCPGVLRENLMLELLEVESTPRASDLGCMGAHFTWTNGRDIHNLVKERLDRAIYCPQWIINFPKAGMQILLIIESDHGPIVVDTEMESEKLASPFRFLDAWSKDSFCRVMIAEAWKTGVLGFKSF